MGKLGDKLLKIAQEVEEREEKKEQEWMKVKRAIREVLSEAEVSLPGCEVEARTGNSISLNYTLNDMRFVLQFTYNQAEHIVLRHGYANVRSRKYPKLEEINKGDMDNEIEEFMWEIHRRLRLAGS